MKQMNQTGFLKTKEVRKQWVLIDADNVIVGRLAAFVALRLRGKHRPDYTAHIDCGDNVIIINARKVAFSGQKRKQKVYFRHTNYPGGLKQTMAETVLEGRFPERVMRKAIQRMLPKESPLARRQLSNLYIYADTDHPHMAQKPEVIDFQALSPKNAPRRI